MANGPKSQRARGPWQPKTAFYSSPQAIDYAPQGGHVVQRHAQVRILPVEVIRQPDHNSRLFFGRSSTAAAQIGQPFFFWRQAPRIDEAEGITWRADHSALHLYRVGYQTVGQPWLIRAKKYQAPDFDAELIKQPDHSALNLYRVGYQSVGQPWAISAKKYQAPDFDAEVIRQPDHSGLNRYRVGYQTVGQPWSIWAKYQPPAFDAELIRSPGQDLFAYRQVAAGPGATYQPLWRWYAYAGPADVPEIIPGPKSILFDYRQITVAAPVGAPWYLWRSPKLEPDVEAIQPRDHSGLNRYRFAPALIIVGTTLDCNGAVVGGATVKLYKTSTDVLFGTVVSDGSGAWSLPVPDSAQYYAVAYKAGVPDIAGTTRNDLTGA